MGRSLGFLAGKFLQKEGIRCEPAELGTIVATACLAHDLGHPPFGHSGEAAIQAWARRTFGEASKYPESRPRAGRKARRRGAPPISRAEVADFLDFEGNAQGFRILVRTAARTRKGGMRPTLATLGAMSKYPRPAYLAGWTATRGAVSEKKPGYFQDDRQMGLKAFNALGMRQKWRAFLRVTPLLS